MSSGSTHRFSSLDGKLIESASTRLPTPGGTDPSERGVFTTLRIKNGRPVFFDDHVARLSSSANALGLGSPPDKAQLRESCTKLIAANETHDCALRIVLYAHGDGIHHALQTRDSGWDAEQYSRGFRLLTMRRDPESFPSTGHKTLDYGANLEALAEARKNDCDEALFINTADEAWECSISNIFAVKNGAVFTPPLASGALPGIIRARLLGARPSIKVSEKVLSKEFLLKAGEVFVTNSLLGLMPVLTIDNQFFRLRDRSITATLRAELDRWERNET